MCLWHPITTHQPIVLCCKRGTREKMAKYRRYYYWNWTNYYWNWRSGNWTNARWYQKKIETMEQKTYTRRSKSHSFYWRYARLLKLNDSFEILIDINNPQGQQLIVSKENWNQLITEKVKIEANFLWVKIANVIIVLF